VAQVVPAPASADVTLFSVALVREVASSLPQNFTFSLREDVYEATLSDSPGARGPFPAVWPPEAGWVLGEVRAAVHAHGGYEYAPSWWQVTPPPLPAPSY